MSKRLPSGSSSSSSDDSSSVPSTPVAPLLAPAAQRAAALPPRDARVCFVESAEFSRAFQKNERMGVESGRNSAGYARMGESGGGVRGLGKSGDERSADGSKKEKAKRSSAELSGRSAGGDDGDRRDGRGEVGRREEARNVWTRNESREVGRREEARKVSTGNESREVEEARNVSTGNEMRQVGNVSTGNKTPEVGREEARNVSKGNEMQHAAGEDVEFVEKKASPHEIESGPPGKHKGRSKESLKKFTLSNSGAGPWDEILNHEEEEEAGQRRIEAEFWERKKSAAPPRGIIKDTGTGEPILAAPPSAFEKDKVERHGLKLGDYQGRTFVDARRWPAQRHVEQFEDEDDFVAEEQVEGVSKMFGKKRPKVVEDASAKSMKIPQLSRPTREYLGGHSKGISKFRIRGCLALTAGLDGKIMIWDASHPDDAGGATRAGMADASGAIQSYWGHRGEPVKDVAFPSNAEKFASCGFDGYSLYWDTESGKVINRLKAPDAKGSTNAIRFKPDDDFQLLTACGDRKLRHWDVRSPEKPAQTYDFHQGAVNTAEFCEHGMKFFSTGDDRKLLVWEWGVPTPAKIMSDISLPSMPATAVHPSTMSFVAVGLNNRVYSYKVAATTGTIKKSGDFTFEGFNVTGFASEPSFSINGRVFACGDGTGAIHFTRYRTSAVQRDGQTVLRRLGAAHDGPVSCVQFHPCFDGVLLSAGWDGKLKWWA